jgi:hypothetical protein
MPSLNAEGSLRPEIRWKPRSAVVLVSAVDLDAPENRLKKAAAPEGTMLLLVAICCPEVAIGWLSPASAPDSCRVPPLCFCLCRLRRNKMRARRMAAPARLPTTLPTTCGVPRGPSLSAAAPLTAFVAVGLAAVFAGSPPPPPPPPADE